MKKIAAILLLITLWQSNSFCQNYSEWHKEVNYVPNLIADGISWNEIADSIILNYPKKEKELHDVLNTVEYLKSPNTDSVGSLLNNFFDSGFNQNAIFRDFKSKGKKVIPALITYLEKDYATRWVRTNTDWDEPLTYLCISDIAIKIIEEISGIYFFKNFAFPNWKISNRSIEERKTIIETIQRWYIATEALPKKESINYYLTNFKEYNAGSNIFTARNLAILGDTINAIAHLERMYNGFKLPCRTNFLIVRMVNDLGKDIAMEDCLHDIYDFRCMADNGINCVSHIFMNAKSHIPFDVLADIVSTERYSRYKRTRNKFIWHHIFNQIATTKNPDTKSILMELLRIDDEVNDSEVKVYSNWKRHYKEQHDANFRVCDFSLYKLNELFPEMKISVDWNDRASINREIKRIIKNENGG